MAQNLCVFLGAIIRKYSNKSGNVRQFYYHLVGISEYIISGEEGGGGGHFRHFQEEVRSELWLNTVRAFRINR